LLELLKILYLAATGLTPDATKDYGSPDTRPSD